ncbi:hypothetical protein HPB48_012099 [Haemaphysalis longicornis]|uniref:Uncharacterized protein n=1 Tax=Haemaphysalis longicornis TaxID=44386 RepID=A0A9J6GIV9_HAELO|nr:hypothetical protein HPB48_012099 [Haemaphysalis longicornis]
MNEPFTEQELERALARAKRRFTSWNQTLAAATVPTGSAMLKSVLQEPRLIDALRWDEIQELFALEPYKQPRRCLSSRGLFSVDEVDPNVFKKLFRFRKSDIDVLANALEIPKTVIQHRSALCDLEGLFGCHSSVISCACILVYDHIVDKFGHLLADLTTHKQKTNETAHPTSVRGRRKHPADHRAVQAHHPEKKQDARQVGRQETAESLLREMSHSQFDSIEFDETDDHADLYSAPAVSVECAPLLPEPASSSFESTQSSKFSNTGQQYSVHALIRGECHPIAYALMKRRDIAPYEELFATLKATILAVAVNEKRGALGLRSVCRNNSDGPSPLVTAQLSAFGAYFQSLWIDSPAVQGLWGHYENAGPRTTNNVEGWHNGLGHQLPNHHPQLSELAVPRQQDPAALRRNSKLAAEIELFRAHVTYNQVSFGGICKYLDKTSSIGILPSA